MILLNGHSLEAKEIFQPVSFSPEIEERGGSATMVLGPEHPQMTDDVWLQDDMEPGAGTVWRVSSIRENKKTRVRTVQLEHVINTLKDICLFGEVKPQDMGGTASGVSAEVAARYLISKQADWELDEVTYMFTAPYTFNGENIYDALEIISSSLPDSYWYLDTTTYPFRITIGQKSSTVACEMREGRNLETIDQDINKKSMYTRVYPIGYNNIHIDSVYVSQNESTYGRRDKVITDTSIKDKVLLQRWAEDYLANHCEPVVTITVTGREISGKTGVAIDQLAVGTMCRIPIPDLGTVITERITKLKWKDKISDPEDITVTLANNKQDVARIIRQLQTSGGRGSRAGAKESEEDHAWIVDTTDHVTLVAEAFIGKDGDNPVDWSRVAALGVDQNGISGRVTATENGLVTAQTSITANENAITLEAQRAAQQEAALGASLQVAAGKITQIVTAVGADGEVTAASICLAINESGDSNATINASKIYLLGQTIADTITANYIAARIATIPTLTTQSLVASSIQFAVGGGLYGNVENAIMNLQVVQDGNNYEIWGARFNGEIIKTASFSRATSLSGAWASGAFTTTASPQGNTLITSLTNTGHWGDPNDNEDPTHFYYRTYATMGSSPTLIDTGNVYEVNAGTKLQDKTSTNKFTANGTYSAASGYIGFGEIEIDVPQGGGAANVDVRFNGSSGSYYIEAFDSVTGNPITGASLTYQLGRSGTSVQIQDSGGSQISGTDEYTIPLESRSVTANGTYTPGSGKVGISSIVVNVPSDLPNARSRFNAASGSYYIEAYDNTTGNAISGSSTSYKLGVSGATVQVQNTGGSQISSTPTLALGINSGSVNSAGSRTLKVTAAGSDTTASVTITDYASGWAAARAKCSVPVSAATAQSIAVKIPSSSVGGQDTTNYYVTADDSYAYIRTGSTSGTVVGRVAHSAYSNGQTAAGLSINGNGTNTVTRALSSNTKSVSITATAGISYNSSTHKYTATAQSKAGSTNMGSASAVSGTEAYDAGVAATVANTWFGYTSTRGSSSDSSFIDMSTPDTTRYMYAKDRNNSWSRPNITWYLPEPDIFEVSSQGSHHLGTLTAGSYICAGYHRGSYGGDAKFSAYTWKVPGSGGASYSFSGMSKGGPVSSGDISSVLQGYTMHLVSSGTMGASANSSYRYVKFSVDGRKHAFYFA